MKRTWNKPENDTHDGSLSRRLLTFFNGNFPSYAENKRWITFPRIIQGRLSKLSEYKIAILKTNAYL